ncbi:zinc metalloprotease [Basidiobolus ranarum]|uniref:CAAX prenyl protease n=1 Tax=Basidiobolus ranarum TaxID=34480 RepID=A0ABR2VQV6_9FUNG
MGSYKSYVLTFSWAVYLFETYLSYRQHCKLQEPRRPKAIEDIVTEEEFEKARQYGLDKSRFGFISGAWSQFENTMLIQYEFLAWAWGVSGSLIGYFGYGSEYEIVQSVFFFVIISLIGSITSIPFSLYSTFVIEQRHGFNKQTYKLFFEDMLKGYLLGGAIGIPLVSAFLWIIKSTGEQFYFYIWVFMLMFQILMVTIYPTYIQPLFNTFTPLPENELRKDIEALAKRIEFPLTQLYVIDGSKRSSHSNAYFYGFFKNKRIVLFDTLLEDSTNPEICAVLGHELGHWKFNHVFKLFGISQVHLFTLFYMFSKFISSQTLYQDFGFNVTPTLVGFMLFSYIFSPVESLLGFFMNVLSRKHEFQADSYAEKLGYAEQLKSGLIKLHTKNKGNMNPDSWYSTYHYSHPPLVERLNAIGIKQE